MTTIYQAVYTILEDAGLSSDDNRFPVPYVYSKLIVTGSELIRQDYNAGKLAQNGAGQTLQCVEMVKPSEQECEEFDGEFTVLKSCKKIPKPVESNSGLIITGIYTKAGERITYGTMAKFNQRRKRRYQLTDFSPYAIIRDDYLYIFDYEEIDCLEVSVDGYFDNPADVDIFNNPSDCKGIGDRPLNYPEYLLRRIYRIITDELRMKYGIPLDNTNNAKDDAVPDNTAVKA